MQDLAEQGNPDALRLLAGLDDQGFAQIPDFQKMYLAWKQGSTLAACNISNTFLPNCDIPGFYAPDQIEARIKEASKTDPFILGLYAGAFNSEIQIEDTWPALAKGVAKVFRTVSSPSLLPHAYTLAHISGVSIPGLDPFLSRDYYSMAPSNAAYLFDTPTLSKLAVIQPNYRPELQLDYIRAIIYGRNGLKRDLGRAEKLLRIQTASALRLTVVDRFAFVERAILELCKLADAQFLYRVKLALKRHAESPTVKAQSEAGGDSYEPLDPAFLARLNAHVMAGDALQAAKAMQTDSVPSRFRVPSLLKLPPPLRTNGDDVYAFKMSLFAASMRPAIDLANEDLMTYMREVIQPCYLEDEHVHWLVMQLMYGCSVHATHAISVLLPVIERGLPSVGLPPLPTTAVSCREALFGGNGGIQVSTDYLSQIASTEHSPTCDFGDEMKRAENPLTPSEVFVNAPTVAVNLIRSALRKWLSPESKPWPNLPYHYVDSVLIQNILNMPFDAHKGPTSAQGPLFEMAESKLMCSAVCAIAHLCRAASVCSVGAYDREYIQVPGSGLDFDAEDARVLKATVLSDSELETMALNRLSETNPSRSSPLEQLIAEATKELSDFFDNPDTERRTIEIPIQKIYTIPYCYIETHTEDHYALHIACANAGCPCRRLHFLEPAHPCDKRTGTPLSEEEFTKQQKRKELMAQALGMSVPGEWRKVDETIIGRPDPFASLTKSEQAAVLSLCGEDAKPLQTKVRSSRCEAVRRMIQSVLPECPLPDDATEVGLAQAVETYLESKEDRPESLQTLGKFGEFLAFKRGLSGPMTQPLAPKEPVLDVVREFIRDRIGTMPDEELYRQIYGPCEDIVETEVTNLQNAIGDWPFGVEFLDEEFRETIEKFEAAAAAAALAARRTANGHEDSSAPDAYALVANEKWENVATVSFARIGVPIERVQEGVNPTDSRKFPLPGLEGSLLDIPCEIVVRGANATARSALVDKIIHNAADQIRSAAAKSLPHVDVQDLPVAYFCYGSETQYFSADPNVTPFSRSGFAYKDECKFKEFLKREEAEAKEAELNGDKFARYKLAMKRASRFVRLGLHHYKCMIWEYLASPVVNQISPPEQLEQFARLIERCFEMVPRVYRQEAQAELATFLADAYRVFPNSPVGLFTEYINSAHFWETQVNLRYTHPIYDNSSINAKDHGSKAWGHVYVGGRARMPVSCALAELEFMHLAKLGQQIMSSVSFVRESLTVPPLVVQRFLERLTSNTESAHRLRLKHSSKWGGSGFSWFSANPDFAVPENTKQTDPFSTLNDSDSSEEKSQRQVGHLSPSVSYWRSALSDSGHAFNFDEPRSANRLPYYLLRLPDPPQSSAITFMMTEGYKWYEPAQAQVQANTQTDSLAAVAAIKDGFTLFPRPSERALASFGGTQFVKNTAWLGYFSHITDTTPIDVLSAQYGLDPISALARLTIGAVNGAAVGVAQKAYACRLIPGLDNPRDTDDAGSFDKPYLVSESFKSRVDDLIRAWSDNSLDLGQWPLQSEKHGLVERPALWLARSQFVSSHLPPVGSIADGVSDRWFFETFASDAVTIAQATIKLVWEWRQMNARKHNTEALALPRQANPCRWDFQLQNFLQMRDHVDYFPQSAVQPQSLVHPKVLAGKAAETELHVIGDVQEVYQDTIKAFGNPYDDLPESAEVDKVMLVHVPLYMPITLLTMTMSGERNKTFQFRHFRAALSMPIITPDPFIAAPPSFPIGGEQEDDPRTPVFSARELYSLVQVLLTHFWSLSRNLLPIFPFANNSPYPQALVSYARELMMGLTLYSALHSDVNTLGKVQTQSKQLLGRIHGLLSHLQQPSNRPAAPVIMTMFMPVLECNMRWEQIDLAVAHLAGHVTTMESFGAYEHAALVSLLEQLPGLIQEVKRHNSSPIHRLLAWGRKNMKAIALGAGALLAAAVMYPLARNYLSQQPCQDEEDEEDEEEDDE